MVSLFVGVQVRIINSDSYPEVIGCECRIVEMDVLSIRGKDGVVEKGMVMVNLSVPRNPHGNLCVRPEYLEPILPEGAQPSEFSFTELMDNLGVVVA